MRTNTKISKQVAEYDTLAPLRSYRKSSAIWLTLACVAVLGTGVFFLPLVYFVYKGKRWALLVAQLAFFVQFLAILGSFTAGRESDIDSFGSPLIFGFLIYIFLAVRLWRAYRVEKQRLLDHPKPSTAI